MENQNSEQESLPKPELDLLKPQTDFPLPEKELPSHSAPRLQGDALEPQNVFRNKIFILFVVISFLVAFLLGGFALGRNSVLKEQGQETTTISQTEETTYDEVPPTPTLDPKFKSLEFYAGSPADLYDCEVIKKLDKEFGLIRTKNNEVFRVGNIALQGKLVSRSQEGWTTAENQPAIKGVFLEMSQQTGKSGDFYNLYISGADNSWAGSLRENNNLLFRLGAFVDEEGNPSSQFSSSADVSDNFQNFLNLNLDKGNAVNLKLHFTEPPLGGHAPYNYTGACSIEEIKS